MASQSALNALSVTSVLAAAGLRPSVAQAAMRQQKGKTRATRAQQAKGSPSLMQQSASLAAKAHTAVKARARRCRVRWAPTRAPPTRAASMRAALAHLEASARSAHQWRRCAQPDPILPWRARATAICARLASSRAQKAQRRALRAEQGASALTVRQWSCQPIASQARMVTCWMLLVCPSALIA